MSRRRALTPLVLAAVAVMIGVLLSDCAGPPDTPPPAATKKANRVSGSIKDERGNVITVPGVTFQVIANGLQVSGEVHGITPPVAANGTFDAELVSLGSYTVTAKIKVPWNGAKYILPLAPVGDNTVGQISSDGVAQDFVWKLSGAYELDNPDPTNLYHWYGAGITLVRQSYRSDLGKGVPLPPEGTKWEFVLTPKQPTLIDGSDAHVKKIELTYKAYATTALTDIPLGVYDLSGVELGAAGARTPLVFSGSSDAYTTTVLIDFPLASKGDGSAFYPQYNFDITRP